MTTITIKEEKKLSKTVFQTFEDLIEEYYASENIVVLHEINFDDLPLSSQKAVEKSKKMGKDDLIDFRG
ncbi:MAG: hypothetical protein L3J41_00170 [Melioribacteraceae bacterium]|nr:hypothetical protein [Melioribacteraceae bacterium]